MTNKLIRYKEISNLTNADKKLNKIIETLNNNKTIYLTTYTGRVTKVTKKDLDKWKALGKDLFKSSNNSLYIASGNKYVCVNGCKFTVESKAKEMSNEKDSKDFNTYLSKQSPLQIVKDLALIVQGRHTKFESGSDRINNYEAVIVALVKNSPKLAKETSIYIKNNKDNLSKITNLPDNRLSNLEAKLLKSN